MIRCRTLALFAVLAVSLGACATKPELSGRLELKKAEFSDLQGWKQDRHADALPAMRKSCEAMLKGSPDKVLAIADKQSRVSDWAEPCRVLMRQADGDHEAVRAVLEAYFEPYLAMNDGIEPEGLFTGYYEIDVPASPVRTGPYTEPVYAMPPGMTKPYYSRAEIDAGALEGKGLEIAWSSDPAAVFFMQIQGSGRLIYPDGTIQRVNYAGQNGHSYVAIGKVLVDMGLMEKGTVNAPAIMAWLRANPGRMREIMHTNPSYVFFKINDKPEGPFGAQGVALTPGRSLAVDRKLFFYGLPVWLETETVATPSVRTLPWNRLMVAQDTGGAIKGPVRGDIFFGNGPEAQELAGYMKNKGRYYVLLPRSLPASRFIALR